MARRRFFVENIRGGYAALEGDEARHLRRVLRAEIGQLYELSDNDRPYLAEIAEFGRDRVVFRITEPLAPRPESLEAVLYAALVKFDRFEWMLEKATELGVAAIVPFQAARSEKGLARAACKRLERWRRIVREASQQSRRDRMPQVQPPSTLASCLAEPAACRYFLDEDAAAPSLAGLLPPAGCRRPGDRVQLLVGPEGGWTDPERSAARDAGWCAASLAPNILRAETAALAGLSVLVSTWWSAATG